MVLESVGRAQCVIDTPLCIASRCRQGQNNMGHRRPCITCTAWAVVAFAIADIRRCGRRHTQLRLVYIPDREYKSKSYDWR